MNKDHVACIACIVAMIKREFIALHDGGTSIDDEEACLKTIDGMANEILGMVHERRARLARRGMIKL